MKVCQFKRINVTLIGMVVINKSKFLASAIILVKLGRERGQRQTYYVAKQLSIKFEWLPDVQNLDLRMPTRGY